jgi:glycosyltransferase involved in cell wall biosynthesis
LRVSIIITNHNYGRYIGRAIQSSLAQVAIPAEDFEIIVVDDGSTDNSRSVIDSYGPRIRSIYHESQVGLPSAINTGIRGSLGAYILRLDADDWLDRNSVFVLAYFLDHNKEIGFVWPDYYVYDELERIIDRLSAPQGAGIMFRKQLLVDIGLYDEEMLVHEDQDILLRCAARFPGYHLKLPLYHYFRHGASLTDQLDRVAKYDRLLEGKHGAGAWARMWTINPGRGGESESPAPLDL